jgi:hypothetical protein
MDEEDYRIWKVIVLVFGMLLSFILACILSDTYQNLKMAEKGFCYLSVDRPGANPSWTWEKCK